MMAYKKRRLVVLMILSCFGLAGIALTIILTTPKPPVPEMELARTSIQEAKKSIHADFIPPTLIEAERLYDSAMDVWRKQNERLFLLRKYDTIRLLAKRSNELARESPRLANINHSDFGESLKNDIKALRVLASRFQKLAAKLPLDKRILNQFSKGTIELSEAEQALKRDHFKESRRILDSSRRNLEQSTHKIELFLKDYFESFNEWQAIAKQSIFESARTRSTIILVDKMAAQCTVYSKGKSVETFDVEFGPNWMGPKRYAGDNATPEGIYKVTRKKAGRSTKYYKALLIDYPNDSDKQRFREDIKNKNLSGSAKIGGLIEIHGEGGKGTNWTNGCIALHNSDMDRLYALVGNNTKVVIVGSLTPLENIISL